MYGLLRARRHLDRQQRYAVRADMCSLCDALHESYGISGRALNNYDAIFLATLTAAQNPDLRADQKAPVSGACTRFTRAPKYDVAPHFTFAAAVSVLLAALRVGDSAVDRKMNPARRALALWVRPRLRKAIADLHELGLSDLATRLDPAVATHQQKEIEAWPGATIEDLSAVTSAWLSEILATTATLAGTPENSEPLRRMGATLGRLIYIFDALDDMPDDVARDEFNALLDAAPYGTPGAPRAERGARMVEAWYEGQRLLSEGRNSLEHDLAAVTLTDNATLVRTMVLDNQMLGLPAAPEPANEVRQLPVINRAVPVETEAPAHSCKNHRHAHNRVTALGMAALAALPLFGGDPTMGGCCDCCNCCDCCCRDTEDAACICCEIELCSCCCGGCGGPGRRRGYYQQPPPGYYQQPPPGYYQQPPRRRRGWW